MSRQWILLVGGAILAGGLLGEAVGESRSDRAWRAKAHTPLHNSEVIIGDCGYLDPAFVARDMVGLGHLSR